MDNAHITGPTVKGLNWHMDIGLVETAWEQFGVSAWFPLQNMSPEFGGSLLFTPMKQLPDECKERSMLDEYNARVFFFVLLLPIKFQHYNICLFFLMSFRLKETRKIN